MKFFKIANLLLLTAYSYAVEINFRVVCIGCTNVSVVVNGQSVPLAKYSDIQYFMGPVETEIGA
eukprot:jgi/Orpsp1_1/1191726/evm.model.d7180000088078.1